MACNQPAAYRCRTSGWLSAFTRDLDPACGTCAERRFHTSSTAHDARTNADLGAPSVGRMIVATWIADDSHAVCTCSCDPSIFLVRTCQDSDLALRDSLTGRASSFLDRQGGLDALCVLWCVFLCVRAVGGGGTGRGGAPLTNSAGHSAADTSSCPCETVEGPLMRKAIASSREAELQHERTRCHQPPRHHGTTPPHSRRQEAASSSPAPRRLTGGSFMLMSVRGGLSRYYPFSLAGTGAHSQTLFLTGKRGSGMAAKAAPSRIVLVGPSSQSVSLRRCAVKECGSIVITHAQLCAPPALSVLPAPADAPLHSFVLPRSNGEIHHRGSCPA